MPEQALNSELKNEYCFLLICLFHFSATAGTWKCCGSHLAQFPQWRQHCVLQRRRNVLIQIPMHICARQLWFVRFTVACTVEVCQTSSVGKFSFLRSFHCCQVLIWRYLACFKGHNHGTQHVNIQAQSCPFRYQTASTSALHSGVPHCGVQSIFSYLTQVLDIL